jgi:hypothetical protein
MNIFAWIYGKLTGTDKKMDEYFIRFVKPQIERGLNKGISLEVIHAMFTESVNEADLEMTFPASLLRDKIDAWDKMPKESEDEHE